MPNSNFNSFLANYWSAVGCRKVRFCIPKTVLNFAILKVLLTDGYLRSFKIVNNKYEITSISLHTTIKFNWIVKYTTQKWIVYLSFQELLILTKTGGYFVLTTKFGVMNDSDAWKLWVGGTLLLGIF